VGDAAAAAVHALPDVLLRIERDPEGAQLLAQSLRVVFLATGPGSLALLNQLPDVKVGQLGSAAGQPAFVGAPAPTAATTAAAAATATATTATAATAAATAAAAATTAAAAAPSCLHLHTGTASRGARSPVDRPPFPSPLVYGDAVLAQLVGEPLNPLAVARVALLRDGAEHQLDLLGGELCGVRGGDRALDAGDALAPVSGVPDVAVIADPHTLQVQLIAFRHRQRVVVGRTSGRKLHQ
jgi:hypothetical protein